MSGRALVSILLGTTVVFAAALWYFQVYAYYAPVTLADPDPVQEIEQVSVAMPAIGDTDSGLNPTGGQDDPVVTPAKPDSLQTAPNEADAGVDQTVLDKPSIDEPQADEPVVVAAISATTTIRLTRVWDNLPEAVDAQGFKGIDATTSPLKFKGCFTLSNSIPMMTETYVVYDDPTPLKAPIWFGCYRHKTITQAIESGEAVAFLGEANITYGVDRVVAVFGDGRSFVWHQINSCGTAAFAGDPLPANCPPQPER